MAAALARGPRIIIRKLLFRAGRCIGERAAAKTLLHLQLTLLGEMAAAPEAHGDEEG